MCGAEDWGDVALSGQSCLLVKKEKGEGSREMHLGYLLQANDARATVHYRVIKAQGQAY